MLCAANHITSHTFLESNLSTRFRASYKVLKSCRWQRRGKCDGVRTMKPHRVSSSETVVAVPGESDLPRSQLYLANSAR